MKNNNKPRILCVDDEPQILASLSDVLRRRYDVVTAVDGPAGLAAMAQQGPFAVIVSDFQMPGMNGAEFLALAQLTAPNSVRILLTGQASLEGTVAAVNEGNIFRFLTKPCAPDRLQRALEDAVEQSRLVTADHDLMERKLSAMSGHLLRAERLASLGTLAGAIGHELEYALEVFQGAMLTLREEVAKGKVPTADDLQALDDVGELLAMHSKNLLRVGRPPRAAQTAAPTDLRGAVADAVNLLRSAGALRGAGLEVRLPAGDVPVGLSRLDAEQVLVNLIGNAIDAVQNANDRPPRVELSLSPIEGSHRVACSVRDNGCGIPKASVPLIFEPYYTTKTEGGTGLGLFAVKQILERAGGKIDIASEEGRGTTVTFEVPAAATA